MVLFAWDFSIMSIILSMMIWECVPKWRTQQESYTPFAILLGILWLLSTHSTNILWAAPLDFGNGYVRSSHARIKVDPWWWNWPGDKVRTTCLIIGMFCNTFQIRSFVVGTANPGRYDMIFKYVICAHSVVSDMLNSFCEIAVPVPFGIFV